MSTFQHDALPPCSRTDAVLAVHLDGDLADKHESRDREQLDREQCGYGFVSDDSLHDHLRDCPTCQQALHRARRLDAVLASASGRCVVDHAVAHGGSVDDLADRLLGRAIAAATLEAWPVAPTANAPTAHPPTANPPTGDAATGDAPTNTTTPVTTNGGTWIAALSVAAACFATWLCFRSVAPVANKSAAPSEQRLAAQPHISPVAPMTPAATEPEPQAAQEFSLPPSMAQRMHAARNRELPNQRTSSPEELAVRVAARNLSVPERLAAARRLIEATRTGSMDARNATRQLLGALASCGDVSNHELTVHDQLLEMLRNNHSFLLRIEQRIVAVLELRNFEDATMEMFGAIVVAARIGDDRLDNMLRRTLRRHDAAGEVITSALRCGVRMHGAGELLLACWQDMVSNGSQRNTPQWAEYWFHGQSPTSFAELAELRQQSRSNAGRVRCCLAMGCAADASTVPSLLAALKSARRDERTAAACGISMLPHRVLAKLLPKAKVPSASLLRAALARAGLRQTDRWLEHLALSKPQLRLLRTGPMRRFPEVVAWFRNAPPIAD